MVPEVAGSDPVDRPLDMSPFVALLLGILQGLTEFLPVSSSGHLALAQYLFGLKGVDELLFFDLVCHLGTLTALCVSLRHDVIEALRRRKRVLFLATLPLLAVVPLRAHIKPLYEQPILIGFFFLFTALILYLGERLGERRASPTKLSLMRALTIGSIQALAVLPGVSRSGATISCARAFGWERSEAARFSFLLAIPAIVGGVFLEGFQAIRGDVVFVHGIACWIIGYTASFLAGMVSLGLLFRLIKRHRLTPFALYCAFIGLITLVVFNG